MLRTTRQRSRPEDCRPRDFQHLGPVEPTAIPSLARCLHCRQVFGLDVSDDYPGLLPGPPPVARPAWLSGLLALRPAVRQHVHH